MVSRSHCCKTPPLSCPKLRVHATRCRKANPRAAADRSTAEFEHRRVRALATWPEFVLRVDAWCVVGVPHRRHFGARCARMGTGVDYGAAPQRGGRPCVRSGGDAEKIIAAIRKKADEWLAAIARENLDDSSPRVLTRIAMNARKHATE